MDDPHDPFNTYRPDMDQHRTHRDDDNWSSGWWILPSIGGGVLIWIVLLMWLIR